MSKHITAVLTVRRPEETAETAEATIARIKLLLAGDPSINISSHITIRNDDDD